MRNFQSGGRSESISVNGMCATSHPLASLIAIQTLETGGNAVDAAIAAAALLGVCEPQMTGLGGDCFVLLKPPGSENIVALNGSGRAPAAHSADALRAAGHVVHPETGALSVTVPTAVDAVCRLSEDWGSRGLDSVLAPAIYYADAGVPVAPRVAFDWRLAADRLQGAARGFYLFDGAAPAVGQLFRAPEMAEVLRRIARDGRAGFYEGDIAADMLQSLHADGGAHTEEDFANARAEYTDPISSYYRGIELVEHPPNGQGVVAQLLLNILKQFDLSSLDPLGSARAHLEVEAAKLAYDTRDRFLADTDHMTRLEHMLSETMSERLAALIDPATVIASPRAQSGAVHKDTVYLSVVDRDRMAVSMIFSIFSSFGSGLASEKYGILFHNRGAGFSLSAGHPNEAAGGKRPVHTIIPGMLKKDDRVIMPFGVMGGAYQPHGHARFISNMVDFGMDPQTAIDAPRCFHRDGILELEQGYSGTVASELGVIGHKVVRPEIALGGAQSILIDAEGGTLRGASDPRKDGCALGY